MKPTTTTEASAGLPPSPLTTPVIAEQTRTQLGKALENHLAALVDYCDRQEADDNLSQADFTHTYELRQTIAALLAYDDHTEQLLTRYREALAYAQQQQAVRVPTLEFALLCLLTPEELLAYRQADPVYQLGWARSYRSTKAKYEQVVGLYAEHATLPDSPTYTPPPLAATVSGLFDTSPMLRRAALSLIQRQDLAAITINDLPTDGTQR